MNHSLKFIIIYSFYLFYTCSAASQIVHIDYYDPNMHVVSIPDYYIYKESIPEHHIRIEDSVIVSFFHKHISELKRCDTIPQIENSLIRVVYVYKNGNYDIVTFRTGTYREAMCKNGRMYHYDYDIEKIVSYLINNPKKDDKTGQMYKSLVTETKKIIYNFK